MPTIQIPVTAFPTGQPVGYKVRVEYAVVEYDDPRPEPGSNAWQFAGYLEEPGTRLTREVHAGARVWGRGRGELVGWRPSAWVYTEPLNTALVPELRMVRVELQNGVPSVTWVENSEALGVSLSVSVGLLDHSPGYTFEADADATLGGAVLSGVSVALGEDVYVEAVPYEGFAPGTGVSGGAGAAKVAYAARPDPDAPALTEAVATRTQDGTCPSDFLEHTVAWAFSGSMTGHTFSVYRYIIGEDEDGTLVDSGGTGTSFVDEITGEVHDPATGVAKAFYYEVVIVRTADSAERGSLFTPQLTSYPVAC